MRRFILFSLICVYATLLCAQNVPSSIYGSKLPVSWEAPFPNGKIVCTLHPDGNITSKSISVCSLCGGHGRCGVCAGTGGQFWYGMGIQPCGNCMGSGRCRTCNGNGSVTISSTTYASGLTIGYDNNGNKYVVGPGEKSSGRSTTVNKSPYYECPCSRTPNFGLTLYHKCKNCGEIHMCGSGGHSCKRR